MKISTLLGYLFIGFSLSLYAQNTNSYKPDNIRQKLEKLNILGSVLYVAAHPDDENTRLIAYYANEELMRTAYLSATRGDGGQNLIGSEIREGLGLIRTQELLAARKIDGGQQFFSRANDFGYSKHPDETFNIWDKDKVLADFVWIFRKFKPDVVITRFNIAPGRTHGHHTASAMLAKEAFELSGDKNAYPEQLNYVDTWQPKKLYWNASWWFFRNTNQKMDTASLTTINVGKYNVLLGESYSEMAAKSRSMHKSQGFGSSGIRGDRIEYLEQWKGEVTDGVFNSINTSWNRVKGSKKVAFFINKAIEMYDETNPSLLISPLVDARRALEKVENEFWKKIKRKEIDDLIVLASGLYISLVSDAPNYAAGDSMGIKLEVVNRSSQKMTLDKFHLESELDPQVVNRLLLNNKPFFSELKIRLLKPSTHPYWLIEEGELGMYKVNDQTRIGKPENDPALVGKISIDVNGEKIDRTVPVVYKRTDPVDGEVTEPITIGAPVLVNISGGILIFGDTKSKKKVNVRVIARKKNIAGKVKLEAPKGWKISPQEHEFKLEQKGEEQIFNFDVTPPSKASEGYIIAKASLNDGKSYSKGLTTIAYDHIPKQTLYPESKIKVVKIDLKKTGTLIGYIEGAGDAIPENLEQVGYKVEKLTKDEVETQNLSKYDAIILGVRAFNTVDWLSYKNTELFDYVKQGGNLIVQYNTSHRLVTKDIAPYPLKLSRDRVAVEEAPVEIMEAKHQVMTTPNKITSKYFEGWVQERGLYFPTEWAAEFTPILKSNDPGETPKMGGLLVAKYGKGYYVYSGYSWFRELPAGVSGAYRIFVNLISLGDD